MNETTEGRNDAEGRIESVKQEQGIKCSNTIKEGKNNVVEGRIGSVKKQEQGIKRQE
jgi:hypothetical protein